MDSHVDRRRFLGLAGAATAAGLLGPVGATGDGAGWGADGAPAADRGRGELARRRRGYELRKRAADRAYREPFPDHPTNGEEVDYPTLAAYSKGLPHDALGEVDPAAHAQLVRAVSTGRPEEYDRIPLGTPGGRKLLNPQIAYAFDLQGPDSHALVAPPAPRIDGAENAAEIAELYWAALLRDLPFAAFADDPLAAAAADDLSAFRDFRGPKEGGRVTPATLFRGVEPGNLPGPYVSQFLYLDAQFGTQRISMRQDKVRPGVEYLTDFDEWLAVQNGAPRAFAPGDRDAATPRYIQTPRDLAHYVHFDQSYQAYLHACLTLLSLPVAPQDLLDPGHPYRDSPNQFGFGTYGNPHILTLLAEVDTRALKVNLFQQWNVHLRMRPEGLGGRIEVQRSRQPGRYDGIIHPEILGAEVLERSRARFGSYLLPQAFPEGSPTSPDYTAGHAVVAGACATVLKAYFNEDLPLPAPVVPDAEGTGLVPWTGGELTVGGELNKLAANLSYGRDLGGVHYRSAIREGLPLGEQVAIALLRDQKPTTLEDANLRLTRFDGTTITI